MAQETETPAEVTAAATMTATGRLDTLILLGTFGSGEAPRALIRTAKGEVVALKVGDKIGREPVVAIEEGRIGLVRNGETRWLSQPLAN
ncbi:hypothetical protein [Maliponia aquimaris]|uniref:Type IV pilus biogenesis n=1 Tax=Maliponia aquimaris TaxID=1673631 RepID=A0A238JZS4_9RHOB|nr:hypothetical protein [Maliponia aquimaris]SMX36140.1 hypothetical protein MAA8898_00765 [Maliponia aquimaris]